MKQVLIASHGHLAKAILNSAKMIIGNDKIKADYLCLTPQDSPKIIKDKIDTFIDKGEKSDEFIIFTDILGGSISNICMEYTKNDQINLITGVNLPMMLDFFMNKKNLNLENNLKSCLKSGREGIKNVNNIFKKNNLTKEVEK